MKRKEFDYSQYKDTKFTKKLYFEFIEYCKTNNEVRYHKFLEKHHIMPRSLGGDNSDDNLVYLTYPEHIFAHYLLSIFNSTYQTIKAFVMMTCISGSEYTNRKDFSDLFRKFKNFEKLKTKNKRLSI